MLVVSEDSEARNAIRLVRKIQDVHGELLRMAGVTAIYKETSMQTATHLKWKVWVIGVRPGANHVQSSMLCNRHQV
jgi:hypothetical protein